MEFRDLKTQYLKLKPKIDEKVQAVCASAHYISGPEVKELEEELASYVGVKHCLTCANGTDALTLALKVWNITEKDAVFVPDFTFFASAECPAAEGGTCVFVDIDKRTFNIDPVKLQEAVENVIAEGKYTPKVVVAVDLFGQPADFPEIQKICKKYNMYLLEDGAQGFGGSIDGKMACSFGDISTTSFFPAKPLGCYGDGGAVFTNNDEWAALLKSYAVHGKSGNDKYNNIRLGLNSRLDTVQAAILQVKLQAFIDYELDDVNNVAAAYTQEFINAGLDKVFELPYVKEGFISSWAQYTLRLPESINRSELQAKLKEDGIPTMVYYPKCMHEQGAFEGTYSEKADCPIATESCKSVMSLPMHPYMQSDDIKFIVCKIKEAIN